MDVNLRIRNYFPFDVNLFVKNLFDNTYKTPGLYSVTRNPGFTVGVSPNIIEASFKALIDSLDYKLYKEKAPANLNEK